MTFLQFFGGVGEIGGNKILLEDGDVKIWLDFGQSFKMGMDYFTGWLQPRPQNGLGDYFEFNLLPTVQGLYAEHFLFSTPMRYKKPVFDAVFLSHAHFDHVNHISFIDPTIPVYCGSCTKLFLEASEETGSGIYFGEHDYQRFRTGDKIKIRGLEVEPIHVDHSIPAAYGFIIHTSAGAVVYTGDIRAHGPKHEMTEEFLAKAAEVAPVALISEGTRMVSKERRRNLSEAEVLRGLDAILAEKDNSNRSVFYTHNSRDTDRFHTFYSAAESHGRKVVVTSRTAYTLSKLIADEHIDLPNPLTDDIISVYYRRKRSGEYQEKDYYSWERPFLDKMVTASVIRKNPKGYIMDLGFNCFTELIDIFFRPRASSPFIYSMSEPFDEDDIESQVMQNWLNHFSLEYHQLHASGHMSRRDLEQAIRHVNPKKLFPVHTENPELFKKSFDRVVLPEKSKRYTL